MKDKKNIKHDNHTDIDELKSKCDEYLNGWKRTQADFENYKKLSEKRIHDVIEFGNSEILLELLPLFSHFNSALTHVKEEDRKYGWFVGLEHIKKLWMDFFEKFGVNQIKTIGCKFDHNKHDAIDFEETNDFEDTEIVKEITPGFELNERVIQPAKVIVCKNSPNNQVGNKNIINNSSENNTEEIELSSKIELSSEKGEQNHETN